MHDTFLFDLDGTLVTMELDFVHIRKEVDRILVAHKYPKELLDHTISVLETINSAVVYLKKNELPWKDVKTKVDTYLEKTELDAASRAVLIEGAKDILITLKKDKKKIGIITRNNRRVALNVLKKCGLSMYVDIVLARDDVTNVKPHPDHVVKAVDALHSTPACTVVVGDHHFEIEAGNKAGCYTVGVLTGSGTKETLKNADIILNSVKDLQKMLTSF